MNAMFLVHNRHLDGLDTFLAQDPNMLSLKEQPLVYEFPLLDNLPQKEPGIYSITGGRQIGKSTVLKQWMAKLLRAGIKAERIMFFTGELINDHHSLVRLLTEFLSNIDGDEVSYIVIDEITYIDHWDKGVKFLADSGLLRNTVLVISGSDSYIIREARMRFPGRRGSADVGNDL
jgi:predicted AAA+ superfamily ATPase